jgi:hypothetical protein
MEQEQMTRDGQEQRAVILFDDIAATYTSEQPLSVLRKQWEEERKARAGSGDWPWDSDEDAMARRDFVRLVEPERARRANSLVNDLEYIVDGFKEDGTYMDPVLARSHRLGDGTELVLRLWTAEQWDKWANARLRKAAEATAKALRERQLVDKLLELFDAKGATYTGDLRGDPDLA